MLADGVTLVRKKRTMVETSQDQVGYISTDGLAGLMTRPYINLRILNCSSKMHPDHDPFEEHTETCIKGARFLDLQLFSNQDSPYPLMMPSQKYFIKLMKKLDISKSHTVVVYETG